VLNVLLCIENRIYREGLKSLLENEGMVGAVSLCSEPRQLASILEPSHCDLILIDVSLSRSVTDPVELVTMASRAARGLPLVALGLSESDDEVLAFIEAGAAAFVTKDSSVDDLLATISAASRGELHCAPRVVRLMQERLTDLSAGHARSSGLGKLSQREHHILGLLNQRMSNKQIARMLGLEVSTIKNHVHNIIVKLSVKNRGEAAAMLGLGPAAANDGMSAALGAVR